MPIVLQPIDQVAKAELAQQLACWAKTANGTTDVAVQYGTCCVSPTGQTLGRWTIPSDLCETYGPLPFTANNGTAIVCPMEGSAEYVPYYIYDSDVAAVDPTTCEAGPLVLLGAPVFTSFQFVQGAGSFGVNYTVDANTNQIAWTNTVAGTETGSGTTAANGQLVLVTEYTPDAVNTVTLTAQNAAGFYADSATISVDVAIPARLTTPDPVTVTAITATGAAFSIPAVTGANHYSFQVFDDGVRVANVASTVPNATVAGLDPATEYTVRAGAMETGLNPSAAPSGLSTAVAFTTAA